MDDMTAAPSLPQQIIPPKTKRSGKIWWILGIVVVLAVLLLGWVFLGSSDSSEDSGNIVLTEITEEEFMNELLTTTGPGGMSETEWLELPESTKDAMIQIAGRRHCYTVCPGCVLCADDSYQTPKILFSEGFLACECVE
jgi:hypothetical protein